MHYPPFFVACVVCSSISVPRSIFEALSQPQWKDAIVKEMKALEKNKTWELVDLPRGKKLVRCNWVFIVKYKFDGLVERYKAWLVAKGYI